MIEKYNFMFQINTCCTLSLFLHCTFCRMVAEGGQILVCYYHTETPSKNYQGQVTDCYYYMETRLYTSTSCIDHMIAFRCKNIGAVESYSLLNYVLEF